ncbi:LOW QUALITY PROTEIN: farnesylcysteine lyase [Lycium barbarum]|uniref:LOW QUALITY PROTEIN: farnesylcysteine lyase n=1 Tax=Lycium barbarum TaxID=112863 RepID=UPI00293EF4FB|nr:LOW QUALITY PROTEIN: farnesylcysteine lyase [Lycium barbarum]
MTHLHLFLSLILLLLSSSTTTAVNSKSSPTVCIIGSGISGSSVAHFLRTYSSQITTIRIFERNHLIGGRMATVTLSNHTFEAGASILHPKNYHALNYTKNLNLTIHTESDDSSFGIWNGHDFVFKTLSSHSNLPIYQRVVSFTNSVLIFLRYGFSLFRMNSFVDGTVNSFLKYYDGFESRPVFETVEEMLKWAGLYDLTKRTLEEELIDANLSPRLIDELVTVITRINYGQSVKISGLAGAVSLAGSSSGLWSVEGGNRRMAVELIKHSDVELHLNEEVESVSFIEQNYQLNTTKGKSYECGITVVATPLDELKIQFIPGISIPERKLQHTYTTFVRGAVNPAYFGLGSVSEVPQLVGTVETEDVPFSSISVLKQHKENDMSYKVFSRKPLDDALLDRIFSVRNETIKIDWAAYPHYHAPEVFAPFILDDKHLYYVNAFENAASTMETSAVAAENIARLILSRLTGQKSSGSVNLKSFGDDAYDVHADL